VIVSETIFPFQTVSLSDAKKKLTEIIERVHNGERIGITRGGKLAAVIIPPHSKTSLRRIFRDIEEVRKRTTRHDKISIKDLVDEGRA
jgi:prevent-host-death family protein